MASANQVMRASSLSPSGQEILINSSANRPERLHSVILEDVRRAYGQALDPATLQNFTSLSHESDPQLFIEGAITLALHLRQRGEVPVAANLLRALLQTQESAPETRMSFPSDLQQRVRHELDVIQGKVGGAARAEFLLGQALREVCDPITLAGFTVGSGVFQLSRFTALSRLTASPVANLLTRGLLAHALASLAGLSLEASAITLTTHGLRQAVGQRQDWNMSALAKETLELGLSIGFLRGSGALVRKLQPTRLQGFSAVSRWLLPQASMLGAIVLANRSSALLGLRPQGDGASVLTDSLVTLLQFNIGGHLFERLQPQAFREWNHALQIRVEDLASASRSHRSPNLSWPKLSPLAALATSSPAGLRVRRAVALDLDPGKIQVLMNQEDGGKKKDTLVSPQNRGLTSRPPEDARNSGIILREANYKLVLDQAPLPVFVTDGEGELVYANPHARANFLENNESLVGGKFGALFEQLPGERVLLRSKLPHTAERIWEIQSRHLLDKENWAVHYLFDGSHSLEVLKENARLREENLRLEEKNRVIDGFLHDMSNTMSALQLEERALENSMQPSSQREPPSSSQREAPPLSQREGIPSSRFGTFAKRVKELGAMIGNTVKLFQTTRKIVKGSQELKKLNLEPVMADALLLNEGARERQRIRLHSEVRPVLVMGEEASLIHSILNLLINACHAMPSGGDLLVRLTVEEGQAVIEISDTGTGIEPDHLPRIFEPHFSTKGPYGSGMGLFMVRRTIEQVHGGRIEVQSEIGRGTTFRLYIPQLTRHSRQ